MKKILLIIGGGFLLLIILGSIGKENSNPQPSNPPKQKQEVVIKASPTPKLKYEILDRIENKLDDNISVLISAEEINPENITLEIKKGCKKSCNISVYNDKKAFELDAQYTEMLGSFETKQEDLTKWKENNYVFVAEHLVATVGYGDTDGWGYGSYTQYPMKDWYYKELKGEN